MNILDEVKRLYYHATPRTIERDMARAITLLKQLPDEDERERVAVFMDGLSQMRSEWAVSSRKDSRGARPPGRTTRKR